MGLFSRHRNDEGFFELLTDIANNLIEGTAYLSKLVQAPAAQRENLRNQLHAVDNECDDLTHEYLNKVNQSFVTPLDRDDMSSLAYLLDDCMDLTDEAGAFIVLYQVNDLPADLLKQVEILEKCAKVTAEAMPHLQDLRNLRSYWVEINRIENQGDQIYMRALSDIVNHTPDPILLIKLKALTQRLEDAVAGYERLAGLVEGISIKES